MSSEYIEEITTKRNNKKDQYDRWQQYIDSLQAELEKSDSDPFESPIVQKMMTLFHHIHQSESKRTAQQLRDFMREHQLKNLTDSQKPGIKQILPIAIQILSGIVSTGLSVVPVVGGFLKETTKTMETIASGITNVGVHGAQQVGTIFQSQKQAEQAEHNHYLQMSNHQHDDLNQNQREALDARKRQKETLEQMERERHQSVQAMSQGG